MILSNVIHINNHAYADRNIVRVTSIANFLICSSMCKKHTAVAVVLTGLVTARVFLGIHVL